MIESGLCHFHRINGKSEFFVDWHRDPAFYLRLGSAVATIRFFGHSLHYGMGEYGTSFLATAVKGVIAVMMRIEASRKVREEFRREIAQDHAPRFARFFHPEPRAESWIADILVLVLCGRSFRLAAARADDRPACISCTVPISRVLTEPFRFRKFRSRDRDAHPPCDFVSDGFLHGHADHVCAGGLNAEDEGQYGQGRFHHFDLQRSRNIIRSKCISQYLLYKPSIKNNQPPFSSGSIDRIRHAGRSEEFDHSASLFKGQTVSAVLPFFES